MYQAQLSKKVCFWYNGTSGEIRSGLGEEYPSPYGFEKIICTTAHEAEIWSARQRRWEDFKHQMTQTERELVEGPMRDNIRKHILHLMGNARNSLNREFLRRHLEQYDRKPEPWKYKYESYLHAEAFDATHRE
jgi:hypothetical protein